MCVSAAEIQSGDTLLCFISYPAQVFFSRSKLFRGTLSAFLSFLLEILLFKMAQAQHRGAAQCSQAHEGWDEAHGANAGVGLPAGTSDMSTAGHEFGTYKSTTYSNSGIFKQKHTQNKVRY